MHLLSGCSVRVLFGNRVVCTQDFEGLAVAGGSVKPCQLAWSSWNPRTSGIVPGVSYNNVVKWAVAAPKAREAKFQHHLEFDSRATPNGSEVSLSSFFFGRDLENQ